MKRRSPLNPIDLTDASLRRVVYHACLSYLVPLGAFTRWAGLRPLLRIVAVHLKPVWVHRLELKYRGELYGVLQRIKAKLRR
jgi:hypothetical protein